MKRIIIIIAIFGLLAHTSHAQDKNAIHLGLKAGLNLSNIYDTDDNDFDTDPKLGLALGAFVSVPLGRYMGIQPEILFSQKGYKSQGNVLGSSYELTRTTSFIDVPLLVAFRPIAALTVLAGPHYSFLVQRKDKFSNSNISFEQEQEFKNSNLRKNIFGFTGGIDINLNRIVIGARAGWDIQNNEGDGTSTTPRYKNVWYQATIGYQIL